MTTHPGQPASARTVSLRVFTPGLLLIVLALLAGTASAAIPHRDATPAYAEEQTILQAEKDTPEPGWGDMASGRNHPDRHWIVPLGRESESSLILQRGGNTWRTLRNGPLALATGSVLLLALLVVGGLWAVTGGGKPVQPSGRPMQRFTRWQRIVHWTTAISFLVLAFTGLIILFGKVLLLPLLGHQAFATLAMVAKYVHNVTGPFFILCSVVMAITFVRHNLFERSDLAWIRSGGGLWGSPHPPAPYFNAGEKAWFWGGVLGLGLVMSITGLLLDFVVAGQTRYLLQWAHYLHLGASALYMTAAVGHIYMGTVGTPGAWGAMRRGTVDENWARTHHALWYERASDTRRRP